MDWTGKCRWSLCETPQGIHIQRHSERESTTLRGSHVAKQSEPGKDADRQTGEHNRERTILHTCAHTHHSGTTSWHCPSCNQVWDIHTVHRFDGPICMWPWPGPGSLVNEGSSVWSLLRPRAAPLFDYKGGCQERGRGLCEGWGEACPSHTLVTSVRDTGRCVMRGRFWSQSWAEALPTEPGACRGLCGSQRQAALKSPRAVPQA